MRNLIWRMAAAVVGTVALVSAAAAQAPAPMPTTAQPPPPAAVQPATPAPTHVHPAPAPVVVAPAPAVVGGCGPAGCGTGCSGTTDCCPDGGKGKKKWADKLFIGAGTANPVGCGCCASEKTFAFGSCKQFFSPGKTCDGGKTGIKGCGDGCGGLFGRRNNCPLPIYAAPYGRPADSCCGPFSYLDR